jgi:ATP-dependent DNA ligase
VFFAFDLVWLDGEDLRKVPLIERKKKLKRLIERSECSEICTRNTSKSTENYYLTKPSSEI